MLFVLAVVVVCVFAYVCITAHSHCLYRGNLSYTVEEAKNVEKYDIVLY